MASISFQLGSPQLKWRVQPPVVYMLRFGDLYLRWQVQPPEVTVGDLS